MGSPQALVLGCSFRLRPRLAITDPIQSNSIESKPGRRYGKSNTILPSAANRSTERAPCPLFVVIGLPFDRCGVGYGCKGGVAEKQRSCSIGCYLPLQVTSLKPDNFTPRVAERREDYIRVEYESPIMGVFVLAPPKFPHNPFLCQLCQALRSELEKKGWSSEGRF
ncbi:hypothetical protein BHE74_00014725 [Ensete ventricosum]|nr:hypothetical protein BHE74_00014725 [Ensete ventricosum]